MFALVSTAIIVLIPILVLYVMYVLATIAVYQENPVIELVEELRKKHSNTNEN